MPLDISLSDDLVQRLRDARTEMEHYIVVAELRDLVEVARPALPVRYCPTCGHRQRDTAVFHFPGCPAPFPADDYVDPDPVGTVYDAPGDRPPDPEHIADALRSDAGPYDPARGAGF